MRYSIYALILLGTSVAFGQGEAEPPIAHDHPAGQEGPRPENDKLQTAAASVVTVQEVLAAPRDDQDVVLRGRIVQHLRGDDYLFTDGTGEIEIEIDDDDAPRGGVKLNTEVEIRGEVDLDRNQQPTIEVDEVVSYR